MNGSNRSFYFIFYRFRRVPSGGLPKNGKWRTKILGGFLKNGKRRRILTDWIWDHSVIWNFEGPRRDWILFRRFILEINFYLTGLWISLNARVSSAFWLRILAGLSDGPSGYLDAWNFGERSSFSRLRSSDAWKTRTFNAWGMENGFQSFGILGKMKGSVLDTGPEMRNGLFFRLSCPGRVRFRRLILDPGRVEFW
ncbi:hypothetical protein RIR_jg9602.t1 [Rhizophagus irregularis DAOM 181602=DAOM 197198]|nr:hypothetical protein RIR_jg9602.t1 [Rhizophagus irregularis DAOM 181602=DAOM 197198]